MTPEPIPVLVKKQIRPAIVLFFLLTVLLGIIYPLVVTGMAQVAFPSQSEGSLIRQDGVVVGSERIGQPFTSPGYFWGRPSATSPFPYNAAASSGSNLGPANPALADAVKTRVATLHAADPGNNQLVPVDLVTGSASGLDPDISVASAFYQVPRIARERNLSEQVVSGLVDQQVEDRQFRVFGEPHVNVLRLNLALDSLSAGRINVTPPPSLAPVAGHYEPPVSGMRLADWAGLILFIGLLMLLTVPVGRFMARVYTGEQTTLSPLFVPAERGLLAMAGPGAGDEMDWKEFVIALMMFSVVCILAVFLLLEVQGLLPANPLGLGAVPWDLALNTATSFTSNTNWQAYVPETTISYFTQMAGLAVQNFLSAAAGMAILVALIFSFSRKSAPTIGNFWVLLIRSVLILLPISFIIALVLVSQGTVQTFSGPVTVPLLDPVRDNTGALVTTQTIPLGPAASQVAIKHLGTNGGGFFNANSAHPFENPTPFSNFVEMVAILIIPICLCYTFGRLVGSGRKGVALLFAMTAIFLPLLGLAIWSEYGGNPAFVPLGIDQDPLHAQPGGNMEGKEVRFGIVPSALFSVVTTATSCGAVNSMHDSFMPPGGFVQFFLMQAGEVVYGGVGSGLYGMIVFVIIAMFIAGLMVGRTPEYLGKKIEPAEMQLATIIILIPIFVILILTSIAVLTGQGKAGIFNPGPHGFSEVLYAFTSPAQNNGSAFAGLSANSLFYNLATAFAMFIGRFGVAIATLALAGSLVEKRIVPAGEGTLAGHRPLFIIWLVFVILIVGALSFLPALSLGPVVEYLIQSGGGIFHG
jgi:potassium-transporting ATPase potassium-binding subunit